MLQAKINLRIGIIATYCPTVSGSAGGSHSQKFQAFAIMKIQNNPRNLFWININTDIWKWIHQGEQIILLGEWNSEASEVNAWMETK